ncbi:hypothetical protein B0J13DRAFT_678977 [Dactylonectria estremocensis]|uniref:C2H2-type domain-containing protein n=1 Tax=Dactylonectria estremocensis TaxID=1079267 RepID=A0A9P9E398_9HYPO|nr:hypothetical protein B0J13DRAFT_678977 [Dactylonectria estremocensis]
MRSTQSAPVVSDTEAHSRVSGAETIPLEHGQIDLSEIEEHSHQDIASDRPSASVTVLSTDSRSDGNRDRRNSVIAEHISNLSICEEDGDISLTESLSSSWSSSSGALSLAAVAISRKEAIVQYVIKHCRAWFDSRLVILARQCNGGGSEAQSDPTSSASHIGGSRSTVCRSKRSRAPEGEDGLDDERNEDEDDNGGKKPSIEPESHKLACPFLKYNPRKYQDWRCCRWGWSTVHRVKEHVYRKHRLPKFKCGRCCEEFKTSTQLLSHQQAVEPCKLKIEPPMDGINDEQFQALRSRKRPRGSISEEEKWVEMYKVIFPDEDMIPSPWQLNEKDHSCGDAANLVRDLGDHARRELPRLMRPRLEDMLDRVIEESLTSDRIVELAQGVFQDILQTFRHVQAESTLSSSADEVDAGNTNDVVINAVDDLFGTWDPTFQIDQSSIDTVFHNTVVDSFGNHSFDIEDFFASTGVEGDSGYGSLGQSVEFEKKPSTL